MVISVANSCNAGPQTEIRAEDQTADYLSRSFVSGMGKGRANSNMTRELLQNVEQWRENIIFAFYCGENCLVSV